MKVDIDFPSITNLFFGVTERLVLYLNVTDKASQMIISDVENLGSSRKDIFASDNFQILIINQYIVATNRVQFDVN